MENAEAKRIIAITMVKNEQDIIESFVRHTLSFADELLVCDHQSTDATREILENLKAEGLPLDIRTEYRAEYAQAAFMNALLCEAAEQRQADFIIPLDADEFLLPESAGNLREKMEALSPDDVYALSWRKYVPLGGAEGEFLLNRPLARERVYPRSGKCIVGGAVVRRHHLSLVQGNHAVCVKGDPARMVPMKPIGLCVAHFHWRSPEQFRSKAIVMWMNIAAQFSEDAFEGGGYRQMTARALHGDAVTWKEILPDAESCDLRGLVPMQTLRYSGMAKIDVLCNVANAALALARSYADMRADAKQLRVTSVVPYLGEEAPFRKSLAAVCGEYCPRHEILVPVVRGILPPALERVMGEREDVAIVRAEDSAGDAFDALAARATGAFVEWVLPGEMPLPQKLRAMVTSLVLEGGRFAFYISDAQMSCSVAGWPYLPLGATEEQNIMACARKDVYASLLFHGIVPTGGLSALLLRRTQLDACGWLRDGFSEGRANLLAMYRMLLCGGEMDKSPIVGILHRCYHSGSPVPSLAERVRHQVVWRELLHADGELLGETQRAKALDRFCKTGIALLTEAIETGADTSLPLWQQYQAMLLEA